eukprot:5117010-Alexandrium_andersonii.AAC.1
MQALHVDMTEGIFEPVEKDCLGQPRKGRQTPQGHPCNAPGAPPGAHQEHSGNTCGGVQEHRGGILGAL